MTAVRDVIAAARTLPAHDRDAAALVAMKERLYTLNHELAVLADQHRLTGADIDRALRLGDEIDQACKAFRQRYYPRSAQVFTALGDVIVASPTGRRIRCVYSEHPR